MMPKMTVTRSSGEGAHAAAGGEQQQQPAAKWEPKQQRQASDKALHGVSGEQVQQPAQKVHETKPQRQASDKAPHNTAEQEPATAQRQQPQRQASTRASDKEKGKAPMVPETPAVPPHIVAKAAAAAAAAREAMARPALPRVVTQLTRKEKEEDWFAMTGTKLPHRPQRRPKAVERDLHNLFPGQGLWEVNRTRYMVREKKSKKRQGGLQAMAEEDDSD